MASHSKGCRSTDNNGHSVFVTCDLMRRPYSICVTLADCTVCPCCADNFAELTRAHCSPHAFILYRVQLGILGPCPKPGCPFGYNQYGLCQRYYRCTCGVVVQERRSLRLHDRASSTSPEHEQDFLHIRLKPRTVRHASNPLLAGARLLASRTTTVITYNYSAQTFPSPSPRAVG